MPDGTGASVEILHTHEPRTNLWKVGKGWNERASHLFQPSTLRPLTHGPNGPSAKAGSHCQMAHMDLAHSPGPEKDSNVEVDPKLAADGPPSRAMEGLSRLVVRGRAAADLNRIAWAIRAARAWLGPEVHPAPEGMHRHHSDLRLRVGDTPSFVTFGKAAYIDLGMVRPLEDGWEVEVGWRSSTLAPLFPVFSGNIVARGHELTLSGWYAPPGGGLGRLADRVLLHVAANGTGRWLLNELERAALRGAR
jgi:hypothetical protein